MSPRVPPPHWFHLFVFVRAPEKKNTHTHTCILRYKLTSRKKKLCYTYRFDPNTQAGSKVAQTAAASIAAAASTSSSPSLSPFPSSPSLSSSKKAPVLSGVGLLAIPSEVDCATSSSVAAAQEEFGEDEAGPSLVVFDRGKPLRVSVVAVDLTRGYVVIEAAPYPPKVFVYMK